MVKLQEYWVKKRCKPGRRPYKYRGVLLRIPKKFHKKVDSFLGIDLKVKDITISNDKEEHIISIVMSSKKCVANLTPQNLSKQYQLQRVFDTTSISLIEKS
ncbi:MAG: hypothetical protein ACQCN5_03915 [Candidatus Bathyarchaeia archaeon]|jgi:hypothetical protein